MPKIGALLKRYIIVISLPAFVVGTIYADYSHTKQWKAQQALLKQSEVVQ